MGILSTTLYILSQSRHFSLVFCFFHFYYPSTNYAHKKRCILRESTLVKKTCWFLLSARITYHVFSNKNSIIYFLFFLLSRDLREILFNIELLLDQIVGDKKVSKRLEILESYA